MELSMVELVARSPVVTAPRTVFGSVGFDEIPMRAAQWHPKVRGFTIRKERGDKLFCGMVWGNDHGEEKERLRIGRGLGGRNQWRSTKTTTVGYVQRLTAVAEAPSISEASNLEVVGVSDQPQNAKGDVEQRGLHGGGYGGQSSSQRKNGVADLEKRGQEGGGDVGESSSEEEEEEEEEHLMEGGFKTSRICDRLIDVFLTERTSPAEWRHLLVLSTEWVRIRAHFYKHCKAKARVEKVAKRKRELNKLARQVKEVDDSMIRQDNFLAEIEKNTFEIDIIVAQRRKEFTGEFFEHLQTLSDATSRASRRDEIAAIAGKCLSLVEAHDAALEDTEAITEAQLKFDNILNASSLEAAANQIRELAQKKELDSTLLLLITKAWAAAKDCTTMEREVKDIMLYLYNVAKQSMLKLVPDEIHIIKHLLSIPDPRERFAALTYAFSPGDELELKNENKFHTSPEKLKHWMKLLVDAYHTHKQSTMIKEAQKLMNPEAISRLEILLEYMDDSFIV